MTMFKFDLHVFDMSSNQENAKWVKILSKTNRLLSRQTPFNRCRIKLVTLVLDNSVRIRIDFPSKPLSG